MSRSPRPGDAKPGAPWDDGRCDHHRGRTEGPPETVPIDVDAAVKVAELLGVITWPLSEDERTITQAVDIHRSGYSDRARTYATLPPAACTGEEWDAIVAVATLVGRRKLEDGAP